MLFFSSSFFFGYTCAVKNALVARLTEEPVAHVRRKLTHAIGQLAGVSASESEVRQAKKRRLVQGATLLMKSLLLKIDTWYIIIKLSQLKRSNVVFSSSGRPSSDDITVYHWSVPRLRTFCFFLTTTLQ